MKTPLQFDSHVFLGQKYADRSFVTKDNVVTFADALASVGVLKTVRTNTVVSRDQFATGLLYAAASATPILIASRDRQVWSRDVGPTSWLTWLDASVKQGILKSDQHDTMAYGRLHATPRLTRLAILAMGDLEDIKNDQ